MNDYNHINIQGNIFAVALNYRDLYDSMRAELQRKPYVNEPNRPILFIKTPNTRNQSGQVVITRKGDIVQAGPSLAVVIAKTTRRVLLHEAHACIAGYVVVNELSLPEDSYYRPAVMAKCQDGFCVIGQAVAKQNVHDVDQLELRVYVNDELKQTGNTSNWIRTPEQIITEISEFMSLEPGDLILTGTPLGRVSLQDGDEVRVEIDQLGAVSNRIKEQSD